MMKAPHICLCAASAASYLCVVKNIQTMKQLIKQLFFDRELVESIRVSNQEFLYIQLMSGKITMKEYIAATKH